MEGRRSLSHMKVTGWKSANNDVLQEPAEVVWGVLQPLPRHVLRCGAPHPTSRLIEGIVHRALHQSIAFAVLAVLAAFDTERRHTRQILRDRLAIGILFEQEQACSELNSVGISSRIRSLNKAELQSRVDIAKEVETGNAQRTHGAVRTPVHSEVLITRAILSKNRSQTRHLSWCDCARESFVQTLTRHQKPK